MAGFGSFNNRDLLALTMLAGRSIRPEEGPPRIDVKGVVTEAFAVADEFIAQSDGRWTAEVRGRTRANGARSGARSQSNDSPRGRRE